MESNVIRFSTKRIKVKRLFIWIELIIFLIEKLNLPQIHKIMKKLLIRDFEHQIHKITKKYPKTVIIVPPVRLGKCLVHPNIWLFAYHGHPEQVRNSVRSIMEIKYDDRDSLVFDSAKKIIVLSNYVKDDLNLRFGKNKEIHVVPGGPLNFPIKKIEKKFIQPRSEKLQCLILGRVTPEKGIADLLKVISLLPKDINFRVAGPKEISFEEIEKSDSEFNRITFKFNLKNSEVRSELQGADIILSLSYHEGFGIAMLEGMAHGAIPIATTNSAAPEILAGTSFSKFIFQPGDTKNLLMLLENLSKMDKQKLQCLSDEAYQISAKYSYSNYANLVIGLLLND
jgi:glycosyltransferase involved in cell wall biosynthesis